MIRTIVLIVATIVLQIIAIIQEQYTDLMMDNSFVLTVNGFHNFHKISLTDIKQNIMENRKKALQWWNNLTFEEKYFKVVKHKELVVGYPDRDPNTLTGREVEQIWNAENEYDYTKLPMNPNPNLPNWMNKNKS